MILVGQRQLTPLVKIDPDVLSRILQTDKGYTPTPCLQHVKITFMIIVRCQLEMIVKDREVKTRIQLIGSLPGGIDIRQYLLIGLRPAGRITLLGKTAAIGIIASD